MDIGVSFYAIQCHDSVILVFDMFLSPQILVRHSNGTTSGHWRMHTTFFRQVSNEVDISSGMPYLEVLVESDRSVIFSCFARTQDCANLSFCDIEYCVAMDHGNIVEFLEGIDVVQHVAL